MNTKTLKAQFRQAARAVWGVLTLPAPEARKSFEDQADALGWPPRQKARLAQDAADFVKQEQWAVRWARWTRWWESALFTAKLEQTGAHFPASSESTELKMTTQPGDDEYDDPGYGSPAFRQSQGRVAQQKAGLGPAGTATDDDPGYGSKEFRRAQGREAQEKAGLAPRRRRR